MSFLFRLPPLKWKPRVSMRRLVLGTLLASTACAGAQSAGRLQAIELVKEAALYFGRGDMTLVVKVCRQALILDPNYPRAYTWLGAAYQRRGERNNACGAFARVVKLAPGTPDAQRATRGLREMGCLTAPNRAPAAPAPALGARLENRWTATSGIAALSFSEDSQLLSGGGTDGSWRLWRVPDGALARLERGRGYEVSAVACGPTFYAVGSGKGEIRFFNVLDRGEAPAVEARSGVVRGLSYGARGRFLAAAGPDGALKVFDGRTQALRFQVPSDGFVVSGTAFSPDGRFVAAGVGSMIRIYETQKGNLVRTLSGDGLPVNAVAWSRVGNLIAGAAGYKIRVWNATDGRLRRTLNGHRLTVTSLAFGNGSSLASGSYDAQLRLWNAQSGAVSLLSLHTGQIRGVAFDSSGQRLASADQNGVVGLWRLSK